MDSMGGREVVVGLMKCPRGFGGEGGGKRRGLVREGGSKSLRQVWRGRLVVVGDGVRGEKINGFANGRWTGRE